MQINEEKSDYYKAYSASLRIIGIDLPFEQIESNLSLSATYKHRKGDRRGTTILQDDRWILESPLPEDREFGEHLDWLWSKVSDQKHYLIELKSNYFIDVFAGYRSDCDHCGTVISASGMTICYELSIPFELSITVA